MNSDLYSRCTNLSFCWSRQFDKILGNYHCLLRCFEDTLRIDISFSCDISNILIISTLCIRLRPLLVVCIFPTALLQQQWCAFIVTRILLVFKVSAQIDSPGIQKFACEEIHSELQELVVRCSVWSPVPRQDQLWSRWHLTLKLCHWPRQRMTLLHCLHTGFTRLIVCYRAMGFIEILLYQMFRTGFSPFQGNPTFVFEAVSNRDRFSTYTTTNIRLWPVSCSNKSRVLSGRKVRHKWNRHEQRVLWEATQCSMLKPIIRVRT